jgi:YHS domain-containing protein
MKTVTTDPVCGMEVKEESNLRAQHGGLLYLFCSEKCRQRFLKDPDEFTENQNAGAPEHAGAVPRRQTGPETSWRNYLPLFIIVAFTLLAAGAKQFAYSGPWDWTTWMHDFMGFFLVVFSMFKFFNLPGFADGFQMYDLLAKRLRAYAFMYPFIELALGLGYLAHWHPHAIYLVTILVMVFGSLGVFNALRKGLDLECACLGTMLKVPLSTVALVEDLGMGAMAAAMLLAMSQHA